MKNMLFAIFLFIAGIWCLLFSYIEGGLLMASIMGMALPAIAVVVFFFGYFQNRNLK